MFGIQKLPARLLGLFSLTVLSLFGACHRRGPEPIPCDPKPFKAAFDIKEAVGPEGAITDNILAYGTASFVAAGDYDSYEWQVGGADNTGYGKKYTLFFKEVEADIEVRLIATKAPTSCFAKTQIDTVYKKFSVILWRDAAIIGRYAGHYSRTPNVLDTVEIRYIDTDPDPFGIFTLINLSKGCNLKSEENYGCHAWDRGNNAWFLSLGGAMCKECPNPEGMIRLIGNDELQADFSYGDVRYWASPPPMPRLNDKFIGKRIK